MLVCDDRSTINIPPRIRVLAPQQTTRFYLFQPPNLQQWSMSTYRRMLTSISHPEVVIAPPALYLLLAREHLRAGIEVAAQNVFDKPNGAFTGEISVEQLNDSGITWTLLGHSERRVILQEDDAFIASKCKTALEGGIGVILCCGESLEQRERGETIAVVTSQLGAVAKELKGKEEHWKKVVIAYEPIWAIGTGKVATSQQAQEVHEAIRAWLKKEVSEEVAEETRIIYGGSVNEKNCKELAKQKDIDGFLVGGASLKPACEYNFCSGFEAYANLRGSCRYYQQPFVIRKLPMGL